MKQIDMSSEAISRRLKMAGELRDLSLSLMKAKRSSDKKPQRKAPKNPIEKNISSEAAKK